MLPDRQKTLKFVGVLTGLILSLSAFVFGWLYLRALENEKERLIHLSSMHVHYLEAMRQMPPGWEEGATSQEFFTDPIQQVFDSYEGHHHFGQTGEVILVRRQENGEEEFFTPPRVHSRMSQSLLLAGKGSSQLQLDFSSKSRTQILSDGRGNAILAAYEPMAGLPMGVVAKINIQEIQFPYLLGGGVLGLLEVGIMVVVGFLLVRYNKPIGQHLSEDEEKIRAVVASAGKGIMTFNEYGTIETFNETAEAMFSCQAADVIGKPFNTLFILLEQDTCDPFLLTYRPAGVKRIGGSLKEFKAKRKDGTVFPLTLTLTEAPVGGHRLFTALLRNETEQKLAERRLAAQYAIARVLADCTTIQ